MSEIELVFRRAERRCSGSLFSMLLFKKLYRMQLFKINCLVTTLYEVFNRLQAFLFKIHNHRKEISSSFVTKEKIIFNRRPKKKPFPSDQVKQQVKYQCWHVNKDTRPWGCLFIFPWGIYEAATFLIPVWSASLVCMNYYTLIYGLAYCIQTQQRILELKETESYGLRFLFKLKDNWFSNSLFLKFLLDTLRVSVHKDTWSIQI